MIALDVASVARPVIKSAGGKTKLLPELLKRMPDRYGRYYEPFCGGAALFFAVRPERAVIGDANADLINVYRAVADDVVSVVDLLKIHRELHCAEYYSQTRDAWNSDAPMVRTLAGRAAAFIYLNRTCFNGLWRVNRAGEFNVPIGRYADPLGGIADRLRAAAPVLARAKIRAGDYRTTIASAAHGDFVYMDSPYDGTFTSYTAEAFGDAAQAELAFTVRTLAARGAQVMVSNADTPRVRALYAGMRIDSVQCARAINSNGKRRGAVGEVIVTAGYEVQT